MEWMDGPRFSSSFGVHEKTAWTRFKPFVLDGEGRKRLQSPVYLVPRFSDFFLCKPQQDTRS